jgi:hypothetical protein
MQEQTNATPTRAERLQSRNKRIEAAFNKKWKAGKRGQVVLSELEQEFGLAPRTISRIISGQYGG